MQLDRMRTALRHLGLNDSNYRVLKLLPLVYVAWADGRMTPEQEERIVKLAHGHFQIGTQGEKLLRKWVSERPSKAYMLEGLRDIVLLAKAPDEWNFDLDELQGLISYAEAIARTTAEAMDIPAAIGAEEQEALHEIARELSVDDGTSWAELLADLK